MDSHDKALSIEQTTMTNLKPSADNKGVKRPRILMIDDDPVVRKIVFELLNNRYTVISSSTGVQLPELLQKHQPDLVILDVMLPWINGFELCRAMKTQSKCKDIPVLFLTACKEREDKMTGKEVGCSGYLTKPFLAKDLFREVERLLAA